MAEATEDSAAYQAYLKGRFLLNRRRQVDIENAVIFFEEAKASDPDFALAHVGLGDSYIVIGAQWYGVDPDNPPAVAMAKARTAAREALRLDPDLAEAYVTLAYIEFLQDWDWEAAETDFLKAIELKPNYVIAHQWYSEFLGVMGRHEEGIAESVRALELELVLHGARAIRGEHQVFSRDDAVGFERPAQDRDELSAAMCGLSTDGAYEHEPIESRFV